MPTVDQDPSSPRRTLSRLRRNKGPANISTASLSNSSPEHDSTEPSDMSASLDGAFDKVKHKAKRSIDERRGSTDSSRHKLSALLPGLKKKTSRTGSPGLKPEHGNVRYDERTGSVSPSLDRSHSDSSLLDGSGHSSLLTDDNSDVEGKPIRPSLSPHHSHAGYLTLSSPEISAHTQPVASENDSVKSLESLEPVRTASSIPQIVEPPIIEPRPESSRAKRSPSPAGRFKGAFSLPRKGSLGDTESLKSPSFSEGFRGVFRPSSRRNSVNPEELPGPPKAEEKEVERERSYTVPESSKEESERSGSAPSTPNARGRSRITTINLPATPPNLVDTPTTLVTPPTPIVGQGPPSPPKFASPRAPKLNSVESIRHRRAQSANIPSRLSNAIAAPLTPTIEETKTPGGTLSQPTVATGFFSSFFSAATKAADQLGTNIAPANRAKTVGLPPSDESLEGNGAEKDGLGILASGTPRAVDTLGKGELNFKDLGIDLSPMSSTADLLQQDPQNQFDNVSRREEEEAATRAVSVAYEKPLPPIAASEPARPLSIASNERLTLGESTPDRPMLDTADGIKRSGSVRSKISGKRRRHRESSATAGTGNSIAAAIQSSNSGLANLNANGAGHRLTGFAVASNKRNKDFHQLFRSVPEDDYLIEDYSAALQRDILLHGRLYVSEGHICFSSNILGWVTNLVISFDEVVSVEKKNTAVIFPNAIVIQTLHARNTFASFVARDSTYELLIGIWKIGHPNLRSSLNGVTLDNAGTGDKTEVADPEGSELDSADGSDDEVYDEDEDDDMGSFTDAGVTASMAGSDVGDLSLSRKNSGVPIANAILTNGSVLKSVEGPDAVAPAAAMPSSVLGPATHAPTECSEAAEHYDRPLTDTLIPAPLGKVYSMMFGPESSAFMRNWLVAAQKSRELNYAEDKIGLDNDHKTFTFDYIKPLYNPAGPKQTKCITTNTLLAYDLEKSVSIDCSTATPDVPSGSVFVTKTRYCLMWGPGNSTRLIASCTVEWTGKSWLKGLIEKGANDGQIEYMKSIVPALKAAVAPKSPSKAVGKKGRRRGKKEPIDIEDAVAQVQAAQAAEHQAASWGIFEIFRPLLDPIFGLVRPFMTLPVFTAVLFALLMYTWVLPPRVGGPNVGFPGYSSPDRVAAYEELWRREESELWDWLEDRVGLDGEYAPTAMLSKEQQARQRVLGARSMGKRLDDERMSERQMDEAIRVTEERLATLKDAIKMKKGKTPV